MPRNTSGLRRGGPGRPKGARNRVPAGFKKTLLNIYDEIASEDPGVIRRALVRGLNAKPPASAAYLRIWSDHHIGLPTQKHEVGGPGGRPMKVEFIQTVRGSSGGA